MALRPISAQVTAEAKFFTLAAGQSSGSTFSVTFEYDGEGILSRQLMLEKYRLDKLALISEYARGSISSDECKQRLASLEKGYKPYLPLPEPAVKEESHGSVGSASVSDGRAEQGTESATESVGK